MITAIILAGGLGTRLREAVPNLPKPMAPIQGKPFLAHLMDYWIGQGVRHFILSIGYKANHISDYFGAEYRGIALSYVEESTPLGTGGGLLLAMSALRDESAFLLLNGDTYFAIDLAALIQFAKQHQTDWCFSLFPSEDRDRYLGMSVLPSGQITALAAEQACQTALVNGGVYWVRRDSLAELPFSAENPFSLEGALFPRALAAGQRFYGLKFLEKFIDIGIPKDYHRAALVIEQASSKEQNYF